MKVKEYKQSWGVMASPRRRDLSLPVGTRPQNPNPDSLQLGIDKSLPPGHAVAYITEKETPIQTLTWTIGKKFPWLTEWNEWNDLFMSIYIVMRGDWNEWNNEMVPRLGLHIYKWRYENDWHYSIQWQKTKSYISTTNKHIYNNTILHRTRAIAVSDSYPHHCAL